MISGSDQDVCPPDVTLIVVDESFGSLDPDTLTIAFRLVLDHAPTLILIAHR